MYKLLLCWRYLLTRYLALACIVSVMLGVATLIVVNSIMSGFSTKLKERLHGLLSDMVVESLHYDGMPDADYKMERIRRDPFLGDKIEAMTGTLETFALVQFKYRGETLMKYVRVTGVDPESRARIGGFAEHLVNPKNKLNPSFALTPEARARFEMNNRQPLLSMQPLPEPLAPGEKPPPDPPPSRPYEPKGIIVGNALASYRDPKAGPDTPNKDIYILDPGDDVVLMTVGGQRLAPVYDRFVICDYFKSEMSEYDAGYVFVPLEQLQQLRSMEGRVTTIQIKLKDYADAKEVQEVLQEMFPADLYLVSTWEQKQGPLLAAIKVEKGILNVLLFLIICVAGFGILAIFAMIVTEKTRDIGILKALGASNAGVMKIFLGYGLLLGVVGSGLGTLLGLLITIKINDIEKWLANETGQVIFDRSVYYFNEIPTDIQAGTVMLVNLGAVAIAIVFSILPALRAAMLHPVQALRYE